MYVIYLDILFMINWSMDFLIFFTVTMILNKWISIKQHLIAAFMASFLYCLLVVVPLLQAIPYSLYSLWIPVMPILFLYKPKHIKMFIKYFLICSGVAALYGGVIFSLWNVLVGDFHKIQAMQVGMLLGISIGIAAIFYAGFYWIRHQVVCRHFTYQISLERNKQKVQLFSLMDTGNLLYVPITHQPVMVSTINAIRPLLSEAEYESIIKYMGGNEADLEAYLMKEKIVPRYLIPFNSVGCKNGYLWGICIEEMRVKIGKGEKVVQGCIVGISKEPLCADRQIELLLHPDFILEGERSYEMAI